MSDPKFKKKRFSKLNTTSEVLQSLLQKGNNPLSNQFKRWKLWQNWGEVVGPTIAQHTLPVAYDKRVLYIYVKSSAMMQEMTFMKGPLKDKINEYMGAKWVSRVSFTLDQHSVPTQDDANDQMKKFIKKY